PRHGRVSELGRVIGLDEVDRVTYVCQLASLLLLRSAGGTGLGQSILLRLGLLTLAHLRDSGVDSGLTKGPVLLRLGRHGKVPWDLSTGHKGAGAADVDLWPKALNVGQVR